MQILHFRSNMYLIRVDGDVVCKISRCLPIPIKAFSISFLRETFYFFRILCNWKLCFGNYFFFLLSFCPFHRFVRCYKVLRWRACSSVHYEVWLQVEMNFIFCVFLYKNFIVLAFYWLLNLIRKSFRKWPFKCKKIKWVSNCRDTFHKVYAQ